MERNQTRISEDRVSLCDGTVIHMEYIRQQLLVKRELETKVIQETRLA